MYSSGDVDKPTSILSFGLCMLKLFSVCSFFFPAFQLIDGYSSLMNKNNANVDCLREIYIASK